jgi:hypothetical protein
MGGGDRAGAKHDTRSSKDHYGTPNQGSRRTIVFKCQDDQI